MNEGKVAKIKRKVGVCCDFCNRHFWGNGRESIEEIVKRHGMGRVLIDYEDTQEKYYLCSGCVSNLLKWIRWKEAK